MRFSDRSRLGRAQLSVEFLEDRTTPAKLDDALTVALPELVSTGAVSADHINVVMTATSTNAKDTATLAATPFAAGVKPLGFGIYSVTLTPGTDLGGALAYYGSLSGVSSAAPDDIIQIQRTPNDPGYTNTGSYGLPKIGAPAAWDVTTGNPNFVVAVIDTGALMTHPDLAANIYTNPNEIAGDGIDNDANGFIDDIHGWDFANNDNDPTDDNGHGTHVSGTIGGVGNNGLGVAGVNWAVKIMPLKFLTASGSGSLSAAIGALNYAVSMGVKVSNNSWGGGGFNQALSDAIGRAQAAGHIFVVAAGNGGADGVGDNNDTTPNYPSNYNFNNVVAVASTTSTDALSSFSNFGATTVDIAAPGSSIYSTWLNNGYNTISGTSMATPHVTGAIALYWGANPTMSYTQVIQKLYSSVDPVATLTGKVSTGGRLNVGKMFAGSTPAPTPAPKVVSAVFNGTAGVNFSSVRVTFDRAIDAGTFTTADVTSFTGPNGAIAPTGVTGSGTVFDITFAPQTATGNYAVTFGPNITSGGTLMDGNGDGTGGDAFTATASLVTNVTRTYSSGTIAVAIRDVATVTSSFNVTDDLRIADLNATVNLTHTWDADLVIKLTSPTVGTTPGKTVTLFNKRGGSGDNLTNTRFDDEATVAIGSGAAPFNGVYRADVVSNVQQLLSAFDGLSTKGVWTLTISDTAGGDVGTLTNWSITVNGTPNAGGQATVFGFVDAPLPAAATNAFEFNTMPLEVATRQAVSEPAARPFEVSYTTNDSISSMSWMSPEGGRREYATQADAVTSYTNRDARDARQAAGDDFRLGGSETDTEVVLYFAPESSASDALSVLLGDAE